MNIQVGTTYETAFGKKVTIKSQSGSDLFKSDDETSYDAKGRALDKPAVWDLKEPKKNKKK